MSAIEDVVILCGGRGTRLQERERFIPKPLVEIGNEPIVWHVINIYAAHGFRRFMLCTGYRGELIEQFTSSRTWPEGVEVQCVDTGLDTPTGGRIKQAGRLLGGHPFCATYADGVANVDLLRLIDFHRAHRGLATMTVVRPELQFGIAQIDGRDRVSGFREKPRSEHWVNGGFSALSRTRSATSAMSPYWRANLWSASRPTGSSTLFATKASGNAWTPSRTWCC